MNPYDICECGDFRADHRADGICEACRRDRGDAVGGPRCPVFRLAVTCDAPTRAAAFDARYAQIARMQMRRRLA